MLFSVKSSRAVSVWCSSYGLVFRACNRSELKRFQINGSARRKYVLDNHILRFWWGLSNIRIDLECFLSDFLPFLFPKLGIAMARSKLRERPGTTLQHVVFNYVWCTLVKVSPPSRYPIYGTRINQKIGHETALLRTALDSCAARSFLYVIPHFVVIGRVFFRYNSAEQCTGAGIRLGGHVVDGFTYGVDNDVSLAIALFMSYMHFRLPQSIIYI